MPYILITRNPRTKTIVAIVNGEEDSAWSIAEFGTEQEAIDAAADTTITKAWGYQVVEID